MSSPRPSPGRRFLLTGALACLLALAVAACGSSSSSSSTAAAGGGGGTTGSASQARLNFAKCMRSHGVNVPDPSANGGPAGGGGPGGGGPGGGGFRALRSSPNFAPAFTACRKLLGRAGGFGNITPAQRAQFRQELVKFAECMRSHNIDIPDPSTSGGGGFGIFRQIPQSERSSPAFQAALKSCSGVLPRFGRGGPGGGPPPSPGSSA
jgi:hypothetical protein